jgi:hypothetical protein
MKVTDSHSMATIHIVASNEVGAADIYEHGRDRRSSRLDERNIRSRRYSLASDLRALSCFEPYLKGRYILL